MDTVVVGFGHRARHGKDTVVSTIIKEFGDKYDVRRYSFADALKREANEAAAKCGGFPQLIEWLQKECNLPSWVVLDENPDMSDPMCPQGKHRKLLQWWGTEYRRNQDPYYWVKRLSETIANEKPGFALISDMRFKNEFYFVKSFLNNGWTVKVERVNFDNGAGKHQSEIDLENSEFDIVISANDGELDHLKMCAVEAFNFILNTYKVNESELNFTVPEEAESNAT